MTPKKLIQATFNEVNTLGYHIKMAHGKLLVLMSEETSTVSENTSGNDSLGDKRQYNLHGMTFDAVQWSSATLILCKSDPAKK